MSFFNASKLSSLFSNHVNKDNIEKALFLTGLGFISWRFLKYTTQTLSYLLTFETNLIKRYGVNSWALITGGSDGIGKEFAVQLAERGFNIILIARNEEKLTAVKTEITSAFPNVQVKIVVANFADAAKPGFFEKILEEVQDLDISILINNVGMAHLDEFHLFPVKTVQEIVLLNCLTPALMNRVFLPKLLSRKNSLSKSAIVDICSISSEYPRPYLQLYGASKTFTDYLTQGLQLEYPNLDMISLKLGFVATSMTFNKKLDLFTAPTKDTVTACLRYFGKTSSTNGHWKHQLNSTFLRDLPEETLKARLKRNLGLFVQQVREMRKKQQEKEKEKANN